MLDFADIPVLVQNAGRVMLKGLGIDPFNTGPLSSVHCNLVVFCNVILDMNGRSCFPENRLITWEFDRPPEFWETKGWGYPKPEREDASHCTGRKFRFGQLVWIHDRGNPKHPIIKKGALFSTDGEIAELDGLRFIHSDAIVSCITSEGQYDFHKLWCVEPIKDKHMAMTPEEMQSSRDNANRRSQEAEDNGNMTVRQALRKMDQVSSRIGPFDVCGESERYRQDVLDQIALDYKVSADAIQPWFVLSPDALRLYAEYRQHVI